MYWCVHGGAGVLIANLLPEQPLLACSASGLTHYLLDWLPHKDPGIATSTVRWQSRETQEFLTVSAPDIAATMALAWCVPTFVSTMPFWTTVGCVLASVLPDVIDEVSKLINLTVLRGHRRFHDRIHYDHHARPVPWWLNLIIQLGLFAAIVVAVTFVVVNGARPVAPA